MSDSRAFVNLLEEDEKTESIFLKDVPVWGTCVLALGCYLVDAATRNSLVAETVGKMKMAANTAVDMALVVKELAHARNPPVAEIPRKIKRAANAVADTTLVVKELAYASYWTSYALGTPPNPKTLNKIKTIVSDMALVVKKIAGELVFV